MSKTISKSGRPASYRSSGLSSSKVFNHLSNLPLFKPTRKGQVKMTDDFVAFGMLGGKYAGLPDLIKSFFEKYLDLQGNTKEQERVLHQISQYIDFFRQWAYRQADGDINLLAEIDTYVQGLYNFIKNAKKQKRFDDIEYQRINSQKVSLTEKLQGHIPSRLIAQGLHGINEQLNRIEDEVYIEDFPVNPSGKWFNSEIQRLSLASETVKLTSRLIKKLYPIGRAKYLYIHNLFEITGIIASYTGTLEAYRNKLDWERTHKSISDYKNWLEQYLSELKQIRQTSEKAEEAEQDEKDGQSKKQPKKIVQKSKYTPEKIKNMLTSYDKHFEESNDVKYSWNCVAEEHSIKSGKAAEMAVRRHQEKNK